MSPIEFASVAGSYFGSGGGFGAVVVVVGAVVVVLIGVGVVTLVGAGTVVGVGTGAGLGPVLLEGLSGHVGSSDLLLTCDTQGILGFVQVADELLILACLSDPLPSTSRFPLPAKSVQSSVPRQ